MILPLRNPIEAGDPGVHFPSSDRETGGSPSRLTALLD